MSAKCHTKLDRPLGESVYVRPCAGETVCGSVCVCVCLSVCVEFWERAESSGHILQTPSLMSHFNGPLCWKVLLGTVSRNMGPDVHGELFELGLDAPVPHTHPGQG